MSGWCKIISCTCTALNKLFNCFCDCTTSFLESLGERCKKNCCWNGRFCDILLFKLSIIINLSKCTKKICNCWCYVFTRVADFCDVCLAPFTPVFTSCGTICICVLVLVMMTSALLLYLYLAIRSHKVESAVTSTYGHTYEIVTQKDLDSQAQYNTAAESQSGNDMDKGQIDIHKNEDCNSMKMKRHEPLDAFGLVMNLSKAANYPSTLQPLRRSIDVSEPVTSDFDHTPLTKSSSPNSTVIPSGVTFNSQANSKPDTHLLGTFMKTVFTQAEKTNITDILGLCRSHNNTELPEFKPILFPVEDSRDILKCLNDMLLAETHNRLCYRLDPEMDAFLRWLLLEGVSREKQKCKGLKPVEDMLFPEICSKTPNGTTCAPTLTTAEEGIHW